MQEEAIVKTYKHFESRIAGKGKGKSMGLRTAWPDRAGCWTIHKDGEVMAHGNPDGAGFVLRITLNQKHSSMEQAQVLDAEIGENSLFVVAIVLSDDVRGAKGRGFP